MSRILSESIIPAQAGWYVAEFCPGHQDPELTPVFMLEAIIAWKIEHHEYQDQREETLQHVLPIGLDGAFADGSYGTTGQRWIYKRPDGKFVDPWGLDFDDEAEALNHLQKEHERDVAKRTAKAVS
jgi:hypothetical protein